METYSHARLGPLLDALGDPTRRAIFEHLGERPTAVVDLAARLPVSRPAVSQHLKVLKEAGLVRDHKVGARRVYSLDPEGLAGLRDYMDRFWNTALQSFKARVEQPIVKSAPAANSANSAKSTESTESTESKEKKP